MAEKEEDQTETLIPVDLDDPVEVEDTGRKRQPPPQDDSVEEKGEVPPSFKRRRLEPEAEEAVFSWELPPEMRDYAQKYLSRYVNDKDMKDSVLKTNPIPRNFIYKAPRLEI